MGSMPRKYSMDIRSEVAALRRRRLIEATVEVLGEVGADRLTMDMVAERADAATRTIYNYFPTRQDLLSAVQGGAAASVPRHAPARDPRDRGAG